MFFFKRNWSLLLLLFIYLFLALALSLCSTLMQTLILVWKVWTQESFQKVEFDRPGERRTVLVDSDWRFDNLCGSHLQSQSELYHVSWWYYTLVIDLIDQLCRDVIGRLSVKPWCYWQWKLVISDWCVSIRLLSQLNSRLLLVKLSLLQFFSRS